MRSTVPAVPAVPAVAAVPANGACSPFHDELAAGPNRNFQVLDPLDFLVEFTQHIPPKGAHLIRYSIPEMDWECQTAVSDEPWEVYADADTFEATF